MKHHIATIGQTALAFFKDEESLQEFLQTHGLTEDHSFIYSGPASDISEQEAATFVGLNEDFIDYYALALAVSWKGKGTFSSESAAAAFRSFIPKGYSHVVVWEPLNSIPDGK